MKIKNIITLLALMSLNRTPKQLVETKELILILDGLNVATLSREDVEKLEDINARQRTWLRRVFDLKLNV
jgi:hypothetical protein